MRIIKVSKGNYKYVIDVGIDPQIGERKRLSKGGFSREKDARAAAIQAEKARQDCTLVLPDQITFRELAQKWLNTYRAMNRKPNSIRLREFYSRKLSEYLGAVPLQQITEKQYQDVIFSLAKTYSYSVVSGIHTTARMIIKEARRRKILYMDPTEFAAIPRPAAKVTEEEEIPHYLERKELLDFLTTAKEHGLYCDYPLFTLLAYTGLRIGEAISLTWPDINLKAKTVRVNKTLSYLSAAEEFYEFVAPKMSQSRRIISIDDHTVSVLSAHKLECNKLRLLYGPSWHLPKDCPQGLIFTSTKRPGFPLLHQAIQLRINRLVALMDHPPKVHLTPHVFRHTHTTLMAEAGVGLEQIQHRLGHINNNTTRRIYLHITKSMNQDAIDKFANFMRDTANK